MNVPILGEVVEDPKFGCHSSAPIAVPMLGGKQCRFVLEGYAEDENKAEFHAAIANFIAGGPSVLREADGPLMDYYRDLEKFWLQEGHPPIRSADELWSHVQFGSEAVVSRRHYGDRGVYVSLECNCDWEQEHGLQIVLKNGLKVNKAGSYDGHLTNADAYDDASLENVVYRSVSIS